MKSNSNADIILMGGDLNADPSQSAYREISSFMDNCGETHRREEWDQPMFYSWCNPYNTFTGSDCYKPWNVHQRRIDHLFFKTKKPDYQETYTIHYVVFDRPEDSFELDGISVTNNSRPSTSNSKSRISLSDHQPIYAKVKLVDSLIVHD